MYYLDARSALHRFVFTPLLRNTLDAEKSHRFALSVLKSGLAPRDPLPDDASLRTKVCLYSRLRAAASHLNPLQIWELEISNPVGLAAGFDKDGEAVDGISIPYLASEY